MEPTHRAGLIPKEVDGVEAVLVQAVQAVALVPALREDVKADHASCGADRGQQSGIQQPECLLSARHNAWHGLGVLTGATIQVGDQAVNRPGQLSGAGEGTLPSQLGQGRPL